VSWQPFSLDGDVPCGRCNRCGRSTWTLSQIGVADHMVQPDGNPCGGKFVRL
jgi:hypothetical protein